MTGIDLLVAMGLLVAAVVLEGWGLWRLTGPLDESEGALWEDKEDQ